MENTKVITQNDIKHCESVKNRLVKLMRIVQDEVETKILESNSVEDCQEEYSFSEEWDISDDLTPSTHKIFYDACGIFGEEDEFYFKSHSYLRCIPVDSEIENAMQELDAISRESQRKRKKSKSRAFQLAQERNQEALYKLLNILQDRLDKIFPGNPLEYEL